MIRIPTIVWGSGSIAQAHKADDYVKLGRLSQCLEFLDGPVRDFPAGLERAAG